MFSVNDLREKNMTSVTDATRNSSARKRAILLYDLSDQFSCYSDICSMNAERQKEVITRYSISTVLVVNDGLRHHLEAPLPTSSMPNDPLTSAPRF